MDLYIRNKNREVIGIIDAAYSVIWEESYYETGKFEIHIEASEEYLALFRAGYFVTRSESEYTGIIERLEITTDTEAGDYVTVTGRFAESILGRRVVRYNQSLNGTVEAGITSLLNENVINPTFYASTRKIDCITLGTNVLNITNNLLVTQVAWENLLEFIQNTLKSYNSSIKLVLDENTKKFKTVMFTGIDRTIHQTERDYILFADENDNLFSTEYVNDLTNCRNQIYVGGEDDDEGNKIVDKYPSNDTGEGTEFTDLDRYEYYLDANDLKKTYKDEAGNEISLNVTTEYRPMLRARGKDNLLFYEENLSGAVDEGFYKYREDYFLGDVVTIYSSLIGAYKDVRIIGVQEVEDEKGFMIKPIFEE